MEWISILDKMPEAGKGVLIVLNTGYITVGYRKIKPGGRSHNWQMFGDNDCIGVDAENDYITHWMPLPDPPVAPNKKDKELYQYPKRWHKK